MAERSSASSVSAAASTRIVARPLEAPSVRSPTLTMTVLASSTTHRATRPGRNSSTTRMPTRRPAVAPRTRSAWAMSSASMATSLASVSRSRPSAAPFRARRNDSSAESVGVSQSRPKRFRHVGEELGGDVGAGLVEGCEVAFAECEYLRFLVEHDDVGLADLVAEPSRFSEQVSGFEDPDGLPVPSDLESTGDHDERVPGGAASPEDLIVGRARDEGAASGAQQGLVVGEPCEQPGTVG